MTTPRTPQNGPYIKVIPNFTNEHSLVVGAKRGRGLLWDSSGLGFLPNCIQSNLGARVQLIFSASFIILICCIIWKGELIPRCHR